MKLIDRRLTRSTFLISCSIALFFLFGVNQFAQTKTELPARTAHVNDFVGVVNEKTRQQLENTLENMKHKTGIEFDIAVVESTAGKDIFDFSRDLAEQWGVGSRTSPKKSLLLVLAVNEKVSFTRFSKSVQTQLPEGVLGQMSQLMRVHSTAGQFSEGLVASVEHFVSAIETRIGLQPGDFSRMPRIDSTPNVATAVPSPDQPAANATPKETVAPPVSDATMNTSSPVIPTTDSTGPSQTRPRTTRSVDARALAKIEKPAAAAESVTDEDEAEEVELTLTKPVEARIPILKTFLDEHPNSKARERATELLVSAHAAVGDQRLKKGDSAGGIEQMMQAITKAPVNASDQLFSGVIAQIPLNLYLRGERGAATQAAQSIEAKFGGDPKRLLAISGFYLATEQGGEAMRIASQVVKIAPEMSDAHQAMGLGLHISLRLDEAAAEYKRALELDPNSKGTRRSLANLNRAFGKAEEALALYQQQLVAEPADKAARAGLVLSLLELGRKEEAQNELDKALAADPKNLALLAGVAYWYAAHNDMESALTFGTRAIELEPRYTWSYVAVSRALIAQQKPVDAERAIRIAREYGKFPTLDYELATSLAAGGLYDEAAEILMQSFSLKDDQIETRLAGKTIARSPGFIELLAPERRASVFQFTAADNESNARVLKNLLAFAAVIEEGKTGGSINENRAIAAAKEFSEGDDAWRVYRQLYAANQLLRKGIGFQTAFELTQAARSTAEAGLNIRAATLAVQAEEYREIRARAFAAGSAPSIAEAPRNVLSNLLRGRIEDLAGWALYNQDKLPDASDHLKRAVNILPEGTPAWRTALWHLGAVLDGLDQKEEALANYIKSYNTGNPDPVRRGVIEQLYRRMNGSLIGLEERIGAAPGAQPVTEASALPSDSAPPVQPAATPGTTPEATRSPEVPAPVSETPASQPVSEGQTPLTSKPDETTSTRDSGRSPDVVPAADAPPTNSPIATMGRARTIVTVKGRVKDSQNNPIGNVVVVLISPQGTVLASTTDEQGNYSFRVAASARGYRIIPSKDGLRFEPADKVLPAVSDDLKELDFTGTVLPRP